MKHWVFDLDGTLLDSHAVYFDSLKLVLEAHGAELFAEDKEEVLRIAARERCAFLEKKVGAKHLSSTLAMLGDRFRGDDTRARPFAGADSVLKLLKGQNALIAIWTAREMSGTIPVLDYTGLAPYFSHIVTGTCVSECKPSPEGLLKIAEKFQVPPSELIMVGDHDNDMRAAKACGAKGFRASWHKSRSESCTISHEIFHQVSDLENWIQAQIQNASQRGIQSK